MYPQCMPDPRCRRSGGCTRAGAARPAMRASVCGSTHVPPQFTRPDGHWQVPAVQVSPAPQTVPADVPVQVPLAPQYVASVSGAHVPPQFTRPTGTGRCRPCRSRAARRRSGGRLRAGTARPAVRRVGERVHASAAAVHEARRALAGAGRAGQPRAADGSGGRPRAGTARPAVRRVGERVHARSAAIHEARHTVWRYRPPPWCRGDRPGRDRGDRSRPLRRDGWIVSSGDWARSRLAGPVAGAALQTVPADAPVQVPLAPQCAASVCGFTHVPPQFTRPVWQFTWQVPALHAWPAEQAFPHVPQFGLLEETSTQDPPQSWVGAVQSGPGELELSHPEAKTNANAIKNAFAPRITPPLVHRTAPTVSIDLFGIIPIAMPPYADGRPRPASGQPLYLRIEPGTQPFSTPNRSLRPTGVRSCHPGKAIRPSRGGIDSASRIERRQGPEPCRQ